MVDIVVAGGGIAGLTAGWRLAQAGHEVVVLEAAGVPGGNVRTIVDGELRMECGPHSFMGGAEHLWRLLDWCGLTGEARAAAPVAANRYILRDQRLHRLPMSLASFIGTRLLTWRGKLRLLLEPFIRRGGSPDESAHAFFVRRFGLEAANYIMSPFVSGVYAGDSRQLGARAAFGRFWSFEQERGSMILGALGFIRAKRRRLAAAGEPYRKGLFSLAGGLGRVTSELARQLGERLVNGAEVTAISRTEEGFQVVTPGAGYRCRALVCAVPPPVAARLLGPLSATAGQALAGVPMAPVAVAHWSCADPRQRLPRGFGFLVPRLEQVRVLGTLFPSQLFADRIGPGRELCASFFGGMLDSGALSLSDGELAALVRDEHRLAYGYLPEGLTIHRILRYPAAIPQLLPDHPERLAAAEAALAGIGPVALAGNYVQGVGIEQAVASGVAAADRAHGWRQEGRW